MEGPLTRGRDMNNEICKRVGVDFPLFAFSHCRDVLVAVSRAGLTDGRREPVGAEALTARRGAMLHFQPGSLS